MNIDQLTNQVFTFYENNYLLQNTDLETLKSNFPYFKIDYNKNSKDLTKSIFLKGEFELFLKTSNQVILLKKPTSNKGKSIMIKISKYEKKNSNMDFSSKLNTDMSFRYFLFHSNSNKFPNA